MKTKHRDVFIHQKTGELVQATKAVAKKLPDDYKKVEFGVNDKGKPTARVRLHGVTMDISEREPAPVGATENVNTDAN